MIEGAEVWREHWFVVARSDAVKSKPQRVVIFGMPVVLLRRPDGMIWALEDRCPHRGAMLSEGRQGPMGVSCPYHGWTFIGDGRCTAMPGAMHSAPLAEVRVACFSVIERDGLVWVSSPKNRNLPARALAMAEQDRRFLWQAQWQAPIIDVQENFLDALHTHTVHGRLLRRSRSRSPVQVKLRLAGDGFLVDYEGQPEQAGLLFRLFESTRTRERAYFSALSVAQIEYCYASGWSAWVTLYLTPASERSTHLFGSLHVRGRWAPSWLVRLAVWPLIHRLARQDQVIVEQQQRQRGDFAGRRMLLTPLDIVRPYLEAAWEGRESVLPREVDQTLYI